MARKLSDEEHRLWAHVAAQVTPLRPAPVRDLPAPAQAAPEEAAKPAAPARQRRPGAVSPAPASAAGRPPAESRGRVAGVDRRTAERLRKGQFAIDARLDLHGLTRAEAHERLRRFVRSSHEAGRRCLLVITGKGRVTEGSREVFGAEAPGVLKRQLPRWLAEPEFRPLVLATAPAIPPHGGAGAVYVLLRRRREPKP